MGGTVSNRAATMRSSGGGLRFEERFDGCGQFIGLVGFA